MRSKIFVTAIVASFATLSVTSCSSSTSHNKKDNDLSSVPALQLGNIGAIPTNSQTIGATFPLTVYNNSNEPVNISNKNISITGLQTGLQGKSNDFVDASLCERIPANGSCTLIVKNNALVNKSGVGQTGQYGLTVTAQNDKGNSISKSQVIAYENFNLINDTNHNGIYFNTSNSTNTYITNATPMAISIPVYFNKSYDNLQVNGNAMNATLIGCGGKNEQGGYSVQKGNSCVINISFVGGKKFTSNVQLTAGSSQSVQNAKFRLQQTSNSVLASFGVVNGIQASAYVNTGLVTSYVLSNGTQLTVNFANTGSADATILSMKLYNSATGGTYDISSGQTVQLDANTSANIDNSSTCTGSLPAGQGCQVIISFNGSVTQSAAAIIMNYGTGLANSTANTLYQLYYYPPTASANLQTSISSGSLTNVLNGTTATATVTVANPSSSTALISSVNISNPVDINTNAPVPNLTLVSGSSCIGTNLPPGRTCSFQIEYSPPAGAIITPTSAVNVKVSGTYVSVGLPRKITTEQSLPYSSTASSNHLSFNPSPLQGVTDVSQVEYIAFTVTNIQSNNISGINFSNLPNGVTIANNDCTGTLTLNQQCLVTLKFAPTVAGSQSQNILVSYMLGSIASQDVLPTNFVATTQGVNIVLESVTATTNGSPSVAITGTGAALNPFSFYNFGGGVNGIGSLQLTITYKDIGTAPANNFAINGDTLPGTGIGWQVDPTLSTCSVTSTLGINSSCTLVMTAIPAGNPLALAFTGPLNFTIPSVQYYDPAEAQLYVRNAFTNPVDGSTQINVSVNAAVFSSIQQESSVIVNAGNTSYFVYAVKFANNVNSGQNQAITINVDDPTTTANSGWSSSIATVGSGGASCALAGGSSCTQYLWIPTTSNNTTPVLTYSWNLNSNKDSYPNDRNYYNLTPAAVGVKYIPSGNNVDYAWTQNGNSATYSDPLNSSITGTLYTGATSAVNQVLQYGGYLYAITGSGIYSAPIQPWTTNGNMSYPVINGTGSTGTLGSGSFVSQNTDQAGFMAINDVSGVIYAVDNITNSKNVNLYTVSHGTFTSVGSTITLNTQGNILAIAVGATGNIYVTDTTNTVYYCGLVTTLNGASCNAVALPTGFTNATNATLNSLAVTIVNGQVVVTQNVTGTPNASTGVVPTTSYVYAADNNLAAATLNSGTVVNLGSSNNGYANAVPFVYNYNIDSTASTPNTIFALSDVNVISSLPPSSSTYSYSNYANVNSYNIGSTSSYSMNGNYSGSNGGTSLAYYSFLPINGVN